MERCLIRPTARLTCTRSIRSNMEPHRVRIHLISSSGFKPSSRHMVARNFLAWGEARTVAAIGFTFLTPVHSLGSECPLMWKSCHIRFGNGPVALLPSPDGIGSSSSAELYQVMSFASLSEPSGFSAQFSAGLTMVFGDDLMRLNQFLFFQLT